MADAPNLDPYAPCRCGSGKKYKFCCQKNDRKGPKAGEAPGATPATGAVPHDTKGMGPAAPRSTSPRPGTSWRPPTPRSPGRNG